MKRNSKYATLDAVIVEAIAAMDSGTGVETRRVAKYPRVQAFAQHFPRPAKTLVPRRLRALSAHDRVAALNGRWFAAP